MMETAAPPIVNLLGNVVLKPCLPMNVVLQPCTPVVPSAPVAPAVPAALPALAAPPAPSAPEPGAPAVPPVPLIEVVRPTEPSCLLQEVDLTVKPKMKKRNKLLSKWLIDVGSLQPPLMTLEYLQVEALPQSVEQRVDFTRYIFSDDFNNAYDELYSLMPPRLTTVDRQRVSVEAAVNTWITRAGKYPESFFNVIIHLPGSAAPLRAADSAQYPIAQQIAAFDEELKALGLKQPLPFKPTLQGGARTKTEKEILQMAQNAFNLWLQQPLEPDDLAEAVKQGVLVSTQSKNDELPVVYQLRHLLFQVVATILQHASVIHPISLRNRNLKSLQFKEVTDLQLLLYVVARTLVPLPQNLEDAVFAEIEKVVNFEIIESSERMLQQVTSNPQQSWIVRGLFMYLQLSMEVKSWHNRFLFSPTYFKSWQAFNKYHDDYQSKKQEDSKTHERARDAFNQFASTFRGLRAKNPQEQFDFNQAKRVWRKESLQLHPDKYEGPDSETNAKKFEALSEVFTELKKNKDQTQGEIVSQLANLPVELLEEWLPKFGINVTQGAGGILANREQRIGLELYTGLRYNDTTNQFDIVRSVYPKQLQYGQILAQKFNQTMQLNEHQLHLLNQWTGNLTLLQQQRNQTLTAAKFLENMVQLYADNKSRWPEYENAAKEFLVILQDERASNDDVDALLNRALRVTAPPQSPNLPFWWTRDWLFRDGMTMWDDAPAQSNCPASRWGLHVKHLFKRYVPFNLFDASNTGGVNATNGKAYTPEFVQELVNQKIFNNTQQAYATLNATLIPDTNSTVLTLTNNSVLPVVTFRETFTIKYGTGYSDLRGLVTPFDFQYLPPQLVREPDVPISAFPAQKQPPPQQLPPAQKEATKDFKTFFTRRGPDMPQFQLTTSGAEKTRWENLQAFIKLIEEAQAQTVGDLTQQTVVQASSVDMLAKATKVAVKNVDSLPILNQAFEAAAFNTSAASQAALNVMSLVNADVVASVYSFHAPTQHAFHVANESLSAPLTATPAAHVEDAQAVVANVSTLVANTTIQALANAEQLNMQFLDGNATEIVRSAQVLENLLVSVVATADALNTVKPLAPPPDAAAASQMLRAAQQVLAPILADQIIALSEVAAKTPALTQLANMTIQNITSLSSHLDTLVPLVPSSTKKSFVAISAAITKMHANNTSSKQLADGMLQVSRGALPAHMLNGTVQVMKSTRLVNLLKTHATDCAQAGELVSDLTDTLLNDTLPQFQTAVTTNASSLDAQKAAFVVLETVGNFNAALTKTVVPLESFNRTIGLAVSADPGEPKPVAIVATDIKLPAAVDAMINTTMNDDLIYNVLRANDSFVYGEHENRVALRAFTAQTVQSLNQSLQAAVMSTRAALEPLLESTEVVLSGRTNLTSPNVQLLVDDLASSYASLQLSATNETYNAFFESLADEVATAVVNQTLTPNQTLYVLGHTMSNAVITAMPLPDVPVVVPNAVQQEAAQVCTFADKQVEQSFLSDKPLAEQAKTVLAAVVKSIVATTQQAVQGTSSVASQVAVETSAFAQAQKTFLTEVAASLQSSLAKKTAVVQEDVRQTLLQVTKDYFQPAMTQLVKDAPTRAAEIQQLQNRFFTSLPLLQSLLARRGIQVTEQGAEALVTAFNAALDSTGKYLARAGEQLGQLNANAASTLYAVGKGLVEVSQNRTEAFRNQTAQQVMAAVALAQHALSEHAAQLSESTKALRQHITKDSTNHNLYLRKLQQQYGVGMLLYDNVVSPSAAFAYNAQVYENMTTAAGNMSLVAAPQSYSEQAAVRTYWSSVFELSRGGTAILSPNQFVNFTRDSAAPLLYTPLLPTSDANNPGTVNTFLPMVPLTGMFQDSTGIVQGTVVFVPFANSRMTFPVLLKRHPVNVIVPVTMTQHVGTALTQLGNQPAVPALTLIKVMQQTRSVDTLISIVLSLLPADDAAQPLALVLDMETATQLLVSEVPETVDEAAMKETFSNMSSEQLKALLQGLQRYRQSIATVQGVAERGVTTTSGAFYPERAVFPHQVKEYAVTISFQDLSEATQTYMLLHPDATLPVDVTALQVDVNTLKTLLQASAVKPVTTLDLMAASAHLALLKQVSDQATKLTVFEALLQSKPVETAVTVPVTATEQQYALQQLLVENTKFQLAMREALKLQVATAVETVKALQTTRNDLPLDTAVQNTNKALEAWTSRNETLSVQLTSELGEKAMNFQSSVTDFATTFTGQYYEPSDAKIYENVHTILQQVPVQQTMVSQFVAPAIFVGSQAAMAMAPFALPVAAAQYVGFTDWVKQIKFVMNLLGFEEHSSWQEVAQLVQTVERLSQNDPEEALRFTTNTRGDSRLTELGQFILRMNGQEFVELENEVQRPLWQSVLRKVLNVAPEERIRALGRFPCGLANTVNKFGLQNLKLKYATSLFKTGFALGTAFARVNAVLSVLEIAQQVTGHRVGPSGWLEIASEFLDPERVAKDDMARLVKNHEDLKAALFRAQTRTLVDEETKQPWHPAKQMHFIAALGIAIDDIGQQMLSALKLQQTGPLTAAPLAAFSADVQTLVDNVSIVMSAAVQTKLRGVAGGVFVREVVRKEVEGVMSYLQRFTNFLAQVPEKDRGFGVDEVLKFAQTPLPAAAFEPKWEDVRKLVAGDRGKYMSARDSALQAITAIRERVVGQYETQTGRPVTAAAPGRLNQVFQYPIDKETYTVLQNLEQLELQLKDFMV